MPELNPQPLNGIYCTIESGPESMEGVIIGVDAEGWLCVDWGMGVRLDMVDAIIPWGVEPACA